MDEKLSVKDLDLKGKRALIRVDFNVPLEKGEITDDSRIQASLPTIRYVLDQGASIILMSHLGRPNGTPHPDYSLAPCAKRLSALLKIPVKMAPDCIGPDVEKMVQELKPGQVMLLENLRFYPGEEHPDKEPGFTSALADLGDVYIDDAFGCAHRAHASITEICKFFPAKAAAGLLLEKEIAFLGHALLHPKLPFCTILGGAKISTKFNVIEKLMQESDTLLIGGAMAFTFFKAEQIAIGNSLYEPEFINVARQLLDVSSQGRCKVILPIDLVVVKEIDREAEMMIIEAKDGIPEGYQGVDIGPQTIQLFSEEIKKAATLFWNGPMGVFECPPFAKGTKAIAKALAEVDAVTIIGGGDSIAAISQAGYAHRMTHISTGGGACLEYIEFGTLPGIEALSSKHETYEKIH
jgi:3-phosphoglycerate kinase